MDTKLLAKTAAAMVAKGKGILAADESSGTCEKRFQSVKVESTEENRRAYRQLLFGTPGVEQYISGVILFDETARQKSNDGLPFPEYLQKKGIIPGIKVDKGLVDLPLAPEGEKVSAGVDEVAERTVRVLKHTVPAAQPGIVFLSGGQGDEAATAHLSAMSARKDLPWPLTFSYSRALQNPALNTWRGQASNVGAAQKAFYHRAHMNGLASQGKWRPELEKQAA